MDEPVGAPSPTPDTRSFTARRAAVLARNDLTGRAFTTELAAQADDWLRRLFDAAAGPAPADIALVAVGGYGRGELAPGSDLDLVIVHRNRADVARVAEAVWYPIWDEGVVLDHSVRNLREMGAVMDADLKVALGLLDARAVAGSSALGAEVRAAAVDKWTGRAKRWLPEVGAAVDERHERAGDLAFLLEPDLKEARGGLRDLRLLTALAQVTPVLADLVAEGRLDDPDATLVSARVELHRSTGRPGNRLALQDQDIVAAALGTDADHLAADLADAGRAVAWASDDAWRRIRSLFAGRRKARQWRSQPLEPGLALRGGEITLLFGTDPASDPTLALRAAAASAERDVPLARDTIDRLADSPPPLARVWPDSLLQALLRLLGAGRPAIAAIETLDQQGVMERLLPEWGSVRNRPQRNAYHRFTVDRHLLETVANAARLVRRVDRPDLLLLGALLHDIGKGSTGDHTEAGMDIVARIGPRLGLSAADTASLVDLVRLHLLLPEMATRRDLDDPATIDAVADAVGDRDTLQMLAVLTEADSLATGPAAWGPWKAGLFATLVERVGRHLDGHPPPTASEPDDRQLALLALGRLAVDTSNQRLTVVAPDGPGLLATVAGVLAVDGASVRAASVRTYAAADLDESSAVGDGDAADPAGPAHPAAMALLDFDVTPTWDVLPEPSRLQADLEAALAGTLPIGTALAERERNAPRRRAAERRAVEPDEPTVVVTIDNAASAAATLIEVRAPNAVGTLWLVSHAIDGAGLSVSSAVVATLGAEVVDTFYVQTATGEKVLDDAAGHQRLASLLTAALGP